MTQITGTVMPPGSATKYRLEGDTLTLKVQGQSADGDTVVEYPDGQIRHHQVADIAALLSQISNQLKGRYNLQSFEFAQVPGDLAAGGTITTGDNVYDA